MKLSLAALLILTIIQGEIVVIYSLPQDEVIAVISSSRFADEDPDTTSITEAFLPPAEEEILNVKSRTVRKRQTQGRAMSVSQEALKKMEGKTIDDLSTTRADVQQEIVDAHNGYRCNVDPPADNMLKMVWSEEARDIASKVKCIFGHSPQNERKTKDFHFAENVLIVKELIPWYYVVFLWHKECLDFKYGKGSINGLEIGHCTQVLWAASFLLGCYVRLCEEAFQFRCMYAPGGNKYTLSFPWKSKTGKSCGDCPNNCENHLCTNPCRVQDFFKECTDRKQSCSDPTMKEKNCPASCKCTNGEIYFDPKDVLGPSYK